MSPWRPIPATLLAFVVAPTHFSQDQDVGDKLPNPPLATAGEGLTVTIDNTGDLGWLTIFNKGPNDTEYQG